jgi:nucleoporin GLE1
VQQKEKTELAEKAQQAERQRLIEQDRQQQDAMDAQNRLVEQQKHTAVQVAESQLLFERQKLALYLSEEAMRDMQSFSQTLQQMEQRLLPYLNDASPAAKQVRMSLKMRIHRRVQQISATREQVENVAKDLIQLLSETKGNKDTFLYVIDTMCLNFVEQGDTQVYVHQSSAYAIAMTIVRVIQHYPEMVDVLMGHFLKKSPYVLPRYVVKENGMSDETYKRMLGFVMTSEGAWETEESYHERMAGVIALYAAVLQTASPSTHLPHPRGIEYAWTWLARLCNLPPRRITPSILLAFLQVAGHALYRSYSRQLMKIVRFILDVFLQKMPEGCTGSKMRLEMFVSDVLKHGRFPVPDGYLA